MTEFSVPALTGVLLPDAPAKVLRDCLRAGGVSSARVTAGPRTPADEAREIYNMCKARGVDYANRLYAAPGRQVVAVYQANQAKDAAACQLLMEKKIVQLGPSNVSHHCSETIWAFDVGPASIAADKHEAFLAALKADKRISKVIAPPLDPAFHIEVPKAQFDLSPPAAQAS